MNLDCVRSFKIDNQIRSKEDLKVFVTKMPPIPKAQRSIESIQVLGSNNILHVDNGNYLPINYSLTVLLLDPADIDDFKTNLPLFGKIEFSIYPGKIYTYCLKNQIDFSLYSNAALEIPLQFELQPLAEAEEKTISFSAAATFLVYGNENAYPIIKITGKGTLTLNNKKIKTLEDNLIIDCKLMEAYNSSNLNKNNKVMIDDFPFLIPGNNNITFDSTITNIELVFNEEWV